MILVFLLKFVNPKIGGSLAVLGVKHFFPLTLQGVAQLGLALRPSVFLVPTL